MPRNNTNIMPIEKIISILSYITMGIVGLIWVIIAYVNKKSLRYFLMYNVSQSMVIAIVLAIVKLLLDLIIPVLWIIPVISYIASLLNFLVSVKVIRLYFLGVSFTIFELFIFLLLSYIISGVIVGRNFYVPGLTKLMQRAMKNYH